MEEKEILKWAKEAASEFELAGNVKNIRPYGSGHIKDRKSVV